MTSSSRSAGVRALLCALLSGAAVAHAALGEAESTVEGERLQFRAPRVLHQHFGYRVHLLDSPDGAHVRQYVGAHGRVFAVDWRAPFKPDLSRLLGSSAPEVARSMGEAARKGGLQRQFQHQQADLVLQSSAYLNQHRGFAYRPSLVPAGFDTAALGRD